MVLPNSETIFRLDAFLRNTRADDFGQPVDVDRIERRLGFDRLAHRRGPRLGTEDADPQRACLWINALLLHFFDDRQHVRRCHHDDLRLEVDDQLHLALGHAAGHWNHRATRVFPRRSAPPGHR